MAYRPKYSESDLYILKNDEFALQFITQDKSDLYHIDSAFKKFGLEIRRELITIRLRLYNGKGVSFNKKQVMKIISLKELEYVLDLMRGDYEKQNLKARDYEQFNAIERTIKITKIAMSQNAPKDDHFYYFE